MTTAGLPPIDLSERGDQLPCAARHTLVVGVLGAHLIAGWALMQVDAVRDAVKEAAPLFVDLLAPAPPPPPPPPPPPLLRKPTPKPPPPVIATPPAPTPDPTPSFAVPAPEPPPPVVAAPEPAPAPPTPPAPPAPAPEPKVIPPTAVRYVTPPAPVYPSQSQKLRETGRVLLRVEIGTDGRARQVLVARSSGFARLDDAAAAAVRAARFAPYTENGTALVVWTQVPIEFELER